MSTWHATVESKIKILRLKPVKLLNQLKLIKLANANFKNFKLIDIRSILKEFPINFIL